MEKSFFATQTTRTRHLSFKYNDSIIHSLHMEITDKGKIVIADKNVTMIHNCMNVGSKIYS